jgi:hypothetical protein
MIKKLKGSLYLLNGITFEAVIFWPYDKGWWDVDAMLLAKRVTSHPLPNMPDYTPLEAITLFRCADTFKVIECSDLPLYIGWPYVSTELVRILKGDRMDLFWIERGHRV